MHQEAPPSKVASNDQLGAASETHPLVRRLDEMAAGWLCAGLPDAELPAEAAREIERLRAGMLTASRQLGEWAEAMGATVDERDQLRAVLALQQASYEREILLDVAAERERMCAAIKAADDKAIEDDYMLDSDDCISVIRGTWA